MSEAGLDDDAVVAAIATMRRQSADWLDTLSEAQLDTPSLCEGWRVRDVAGHLAQAVTVSGSAMLLQVVRSGFSPDRANTVFARRLGAHRPQESLREHADSVLRLPVIGVHGQLVDLQVHNADMRVPLGAEWSPEPAYAAEALRFLDGGAIGFVAKKLAGRLRVVATDADVSWGSGAEVRGKAYDLVVALCGRGHPLERLEGPGTDVIAEATGH